MSFTQNLVNISETWAPVETYGVAITPLFTLSRTGWQSSFICLICYPIYFHKSSNKFEREWKLESRVIPHTFPHAQIFDILTKACVKPVWIYYVTSYIYIPAWGGVLWFSIKLGEK